jgi:hypothetical protein
MPIEINKETLRLKQMLNSNPKELHQICALMVFMIRIGAMALLGSCTFWGIQ